MLVYLCLQSRLLQTLEAMLRSPRCISSCLAAVDRAVQEIRYPEHVARVSKLLQYVNQLRFTLERGSI